MKYFNNCKTIEELKKAYRKQAQANHPDNGGNAEVMKAINAEYEKMFNRLKAAHNQDASTGRTKKMNETAAEYMDIIQKIISFVGIEIEVCGSWVWVSGDTYRYKAELKAAGFRWASKKKMWYWRNEEDACKSNGKSKSMEYIRETYGSEKYATAKQMYIA